MLSPSFAAIQATSLEVLKSFSPNYGITMADIRELEYATQHAQEVKADSLGVIKLPRNKPSVMHPLIFDNTDLGFDFIDIGGIAGRPHPGITGLRKYSKKQRDPDTIKIKNLQSLREEADGTLLYNPTVRRGKILYIPKLIVYTQDRGPLGNTAIFLHETTHWNDFANTARRTELFNAIVNTPIAAPTFERRAYAVQYMAEVILGSSKEGDAEELANDIESGKVDYDQVDKSSTLAVALSLVYGDFTEPTTKLKEAQEYVAKNLSS